MKKLFTKFAVIALSLALLSMLFSLSVCAEATSETQTDSPYVTQCPECAAINNSDPYCHSCGASLPEKQVHWQCKNTDEEGQVCDAQNDSAFCTKCGAARPEPENNDMMFHFSPMSFVENLTYMGAGMIGIFLVIVVIILTIVILGKITAPRKDSEE